MRMGLSQAPGTFVRLMHHVLRPYIGVFVVVYFDDILVFSKTMKEHINHVKSVLQTLRKERLYANLNACLVLTKWFSWVLLYLPRVSMLMKLRLRQLKLGPNPPICNKCVVFLVLQDFMAALWKTLAQLPLLCMPWVKRMLLFVWGSLQSTAFDELVFAYSCSDSRFAQLWENFWGSLWCKWYRNWRSFDARKTSHCLF